MRWLPFADFPISILAFQEFRLEKKVWNTTTDDTASKKIVRLLGRRRSREKSEKDVCNVPITVRLNEEEHEKLKQCATSCGLFAAEFMGQLCKGSDPQPQPKTEFWKLINTLYEVHDAFKKCIPYYPTAAETCKDIEGFILEVQQTFTSAQSFYVEKLIEHSDAGTMYIPTNEEMCEMEKNI